MTDLAGHKSMIKFSLIRTAVIMVMLGALEKSILELFLKRKSSEKNTSGATAKRNQHFCAYFPVKQKMKAKSVYFLHAKQINIMSDFLLSGPKAL